MRTTKPLKKKNKIKKINKFAHFEQCSAKFKVSLVILTAKLLCSHCMLEEFRGAGVCL